MKAWIWLAASLSLTSAAAAQPTPPPSGPPATTTATAPPASEDRPDGMSVGIGVGYTFPTSLQTPNTTSVRLRLASGITFEPQAVFAATTIDMRAGANKQRQLALGSLVRYPLRVRGAVDLEAIGSAAVSVHTVDPDGNNNNRTTTTFDLGYGVALAYWSTAHWNLSLTATNSLVSVEQTRQEMGPDNRSTHRSTTFGLVFEPLVAVMIHLYD